MELERRHVKQYFSFSTHLFTVQSNEVDPFQSPPNPGPVSNPNPAKSVQVQ